MIMALLLFRKLSALFLKPCIQKVLKEDLEGVGNVGSTMPKDQITFGI